MRIGQWMKDVCNIRHNIIIMGGYSVYEAIIALKPSRLRFKMGQSTGLWEPSGGPFSHVLYIYIFFSLFYETRRNSRIQLHKLWWWRWRSQESVSHVGSATAACLHSVIFICWEYALAKLGFCASTFQLCRARGADKSLNYRWKYWC